MKIGLIAVMVPVLFAGLGGCLTDPQPDPHPPERYRARGTWWLETTLECDVPPWIEWVVAHGKVEGPIPQSGFLPFTYEPLASRAIERYAASLVGGSVSGFAYRTNALSFGSCEAPGDWRYWMLLYGVHEPPDSNWTRIESPKWAYVSDHCRSAPWERWAQDAGRWPEFLESHATGTDDSTIRSVSDDRLVRIVEEYYWRAGIRFDNGQAIWIRNYHWEDRDIQWDECTYTVTADGFDGRVDGWLPHADWYETRQA